ncbi:MAG: MFS transporter [Ruminococcaceae bacterium]|nr:MFS transporter [Oscillospiraceae bacterium]
MEQGYNKTITACFVGYIVQAIVNNFVPLLFLTFHRIYSIPLTQITLLVTLNFAIQLLVDLLSVGFVDRLGYRTCMVLAHMFSAVGFVLLTILPDLMSSAFWGILLSVMVYAVGGGLLEVLVSPVVEACPTDNKEKTMSMLHSFYCWGHVGVVLLSTVFFRLFGIENWKILALLWAFIPLANAVAFMKVPVAPLLAEGDTGMSVKELLRNKLFWLLLLMMLCSGASEQAVSQWASALMEKEFGISKTVGDLVGPMMFAVLMGTARAYYGKRGDRMNLNRFMVFSCGLAIAAYLGVALLPIPALSLVCCGLCGLSVGIMWPGTFSKASVVLRKGGTAMFALLALCGDLGCSLGPTVVGFVSGLANDNLKLGILVAVVFPAMLLWGLWRCGKKTA